jgi:hypothetical protein
MLSGSHLGRFLQYLVGCFLIVNSAQADWRFVSHLPQGNDLYAAWAPAPNNLFVGGDGGTVLHWDGNAWSTMDTPTQKTIFSIQGISGSDVWAVGGDGYASDHHERSLVMHYNGADWSLVNPPVFSDFTYTLQGLSSIAANDVWAVNDGGPSLVHWDGSSWQFELISLALEGKFYATFAFGPDHLFACGSHGQIVHRDHGVWKLEQKTETGSFSVNLLTSIWGADLDHFYVAGTYGQIYKRNPDGSWTSITLPQPNEEDNSIRAMWGSSASDIYLMGNTHIRHWDGSNPPVRYEFERLIRKQWFTGTGAAGFLYLAGPAGAVHEFQVDGGVLSPLAAGEAEGYRLSQIRAAGCGPDGFLLCGASEYTPDYPIQYFDGAKVMNFPVLPPGMNQQTWVRAVQVNAPDDFTVNWYADLSFSHGTYHWDGKVWEPLGTQFMSETPLLVKEFWRSPTGKLFACETYRVQRYEDPEWTALFPFDQVPADTGFTCIWGRSDSDIFIGSDRGRIWRYNGLTWAEETTPEDVPLVSIVGNATDVYAVGEDGTAWRRSGTNWQQLAGIEVREGDDFLSAVIGDDGIYASQTTPGIYVGGGLGRLWKLNGSIATRVLAGLSTPLNALARTTTGALFGIGLGPAGVVILSNTPPPANLVLQRVDLSKTEWNPLGATGIEIQPGFSTPGKPMVAAWRVDHTPAFFRIGGATSLDVGGQQWMILQDTFINGTALPQSLLRIGYDPASLPPGMPLDLSVLHRYGPSGWRAVRTDVDSLAHTATVLEATQLSPWAFAEVPALPTPAPTPTVTETATVTPTGTPTFTATITPTSTPHPGDLDGDEKLTVSDFLWLHLHWYVVNDPLDAKDMVQLLRYWRE